MFAFTSCGSFFENDVDEMIDSYNTGFITSTSSNSGSNPGDDDFNADDMLKDYYIVSSNSTFILTAPSADSYKWTFKSEDNKEDLTNDVKFMTGYHSWTKTIMIYMPSAGSLKAGNTYRLTLTIKTTGGAEYTDSCGLVIYSMLDHTED